MKLLIVLFLVGFVASNANPIEKLLKDIKEIHEDCLKSSQCDKDLIKKHLKGGEVDDPKLREYLLCASQKRGYRNEAGVYQKEAHKQSLMKLVKDEKTVDDIIAKCEISKDTPGESVLLSSRCFGKEVGKIIAAKYAEKVEKSKTECYTESGVTPEANEGIVKGIKSSDPKVKEYALCMMKKLHSISDDGVINNEVVKAGLYVSIRNRDKVNEIVDKCCKQLDTPQETAYNYALCRFKLTAK